MSGDSQFELQLSKPEGNATAPGASSASVAPAAPSTPAPPAASQPSLRPQPPPRSVNAAPAASPAPAPAGATPPEFVRRPVVATSRPQVTREPVRRPPPSGSIAAERARSIAQPPAAGAVKPPLPVPPEVAAAASAPSAPSAAATATTPDSLPKMAPASTALPTPRPAPVAQLAAALPVNPAVAVGEAAAFAATVAPAPGLAIRRPPRLVRRARDIARLMRLDRPIGIWLLLWPELWALWVASSGHPSRELLAIFAIGTLVMRSAGCVINDLFDRNIDPHVRRTQSRPLAARVVGPYEALTVFAILLGMAGVLALHLDRLTLELAFVGAGLTVTYPLLKRFFPFPQLYLGLAFGWAVPLAFAATQDQVPRIGWLLLLPAVLWAGIYDTMYAMADRDDDLRIGVQSSAVLFADMDRPMIGAMQIMMLLALWLVGRTLHFGSAYQTALIVSGALFAWQQWLIRQRDRDACLAAFQNNQYVGIAIFAGILIEYVSPA
ncbi:MAG TPA: 4-hydroxybenzoate octaprenyltransferase [Steroidobacteraceae bacterium]|nr:4-hydroxybenzoate octaprenyltransferase [Steroidobacteraceae bacterium]